MNGLLHAPWLSSLGWALVHSLWEGALVALGTALLLRSMRGATSRSRYLVAVLALLLFAGLPLRRVVATPSASERTWILEQVTLRPNPSTASAPGPLPIPALRTRAAERLERALPWMVLVWAAGMLILLLRLAGGWLWLQRLRWRRAELAPDSLQRQLLDLCRRAGLKRAVTLLGCEGLPGPSVVGFLRPAILVPTGWFLNMSPAHVEALLAHELAHVLRHDYLVNLLQSLLEVLFFYHPGLWWLSRRIRQERELACDAFATHLLGDPLPLAEALTHLERRGLGHVSLEPALAAHGGSLMERIRHLLLPPPRTSSTPMFGAAVLLALVLASGLHLAAQAPTTLGMPVNVELPEGQTVDWNTTHLYMHIRHAKDAEGKMVPYTFLIDFVANEIPLNQAWATFQEGFKTVARGDSEVQTFSRRDTKVEGPRVSFDLKGLTPAEAQTTLQRLANEHGVPPYIAPPTHALGNFTVRKHTEKDGSTRYDLHARQASRACLKRLIDSARKIEASSEAKDAEIGFSRDSDMDPGPKVDAIFEDLPLAELEKRVNELIERSK